MATALCPDCNRKVVIGVKPKKGRLISCPHCDVDLEIVSVSPLKLDWPEYDEEFENDDWGDDDFDDLDDWDDDEDEEFLDLDDDED